MIVNVLVELSNKNIDRTFSYYVPECLREKIKIGIRVKVPFNNQTLEGFILEVLSNNDIKELKEIIDVVDEDIILNEELLELGKYIKDKTICTLISAYQAMLPKALKAQNRTLINKRFDKYIELNVSEYSLSNYRLNEPQKEILEIVIANNIVRKNELTAISTSSVKTLLNKKVLREVERETYRLNVNSLEKDNIHILTDDQQKIVDTVIKNEELPKNYLLHGVTGSGKTEVYMEIIEHMRSLGKTSIVLVPEISLTPQMVLRFTRRFDNIAILHSRLSEGEKYDEYRRIAKGEVDIVIGARSAIFAPLSSIGVIIIDEEHSNTYKQENNPKYDAVDIAIKRSEYHKCSVILGSATPTLESYTKAIVKRYDLLELKNRVNNKLLPNVQIIDMHKEIKKNGYFSSDLIKAINEKLEKKEQIILLLNRRGHSSFVTCSNCGYVAKCPNCDITLTYHKTSDMCRCHYCGYATKRLISCPECHEDSIKNLGVGTEKIEEELHKLVAAKIVRMDFDTTNTKGAHEKIITDFMEHKYDILLGTQMIAKGLDFPNVTLVGVINADTSLIIPNFRSSEYTFQLLSQVAGRSGRGDKEGIVIIQTFNKEHYAIELARTHDYINFYKKEMSIRKELGYPPYYYIVSIKVMSSDYDIARNESNKISNILKRELINSKVLGPSIGSTFKVNNIYRFGIVIKYKKEDRLYGVLNNLIEAYKSNNKVKIDIDFNPNNI